MTADRELAEELLRRWNEIWKDPAHAKEAEGAFYEFEQYYETLSDEEKERAVPVFADWIRGGEPGTSAAALHLAGKYQIVHLLPAVEELILSIDRKLVLVNRERFVLEGDRSLPVRLREELRDPTVGQERQRLRRAYQSFYTAELIKPTKLDSELDEAYDRIDKLDVLVLQASCLLGGQEFDRTLLKTDPHARELLERLISAGDPIVRPIAEAYLRRLEVIDEVLDAGRSLQKP